jgi:hypothetical protein
VLDLSNCSIHDSDHGYGWQTWELRTAFENLRSGGLLVCDDADDSYAFLDLCKDVQRRPVFLIERSRIVGFVTR